MSLYSSPQFSIYKILTRRIHSHMLQHVSLGMQTVFNILPSKQPIAPASVPLAGSRTCPLPGSKLHTMGLWQLPANIAQDMSHDPL